MKHEFLETTAQAAEARLQAKKRDNFYLGYGKRGFDIAFSLFLLVPMSITAAILLLINPIFNAGPLFYVQIRMGKDCRAFPTIKFRSMRPIDRVARQADEPLEHERITRLGRILRKSRFDELPQVINVLRGEMSLIGPRPDYFHHARRYLRQVPGYRQRHSVLPGITGLAQTDLGYVSSIEATKAKVLLDLRYVRDASLKLDAYVFYRTVLTVCGRRGS